MASTELQTASVEVSLRGEVMNLALAGPLSIETLAEVWHATFDPIHQHQPGRIVVDGGGVTYCDGGGLSLFAELRRVAAKLNCEFSLQGLTPDLRDLVNLSTLEDPTAPQLSPIKPLGLVSRCGQATVNAYHDVIAIVAFLGEVLGAFVWTAVHPQKFRGRDFLRAAENTGANAVAVVCLLGFLIGVILSFQSAIAMQRYGVTEVIPVMVSIAVLRELGPLIAVILLAGRSGSAFAAELGTMKVTEEINALRTLGLNPVRFLVVPRVLAVLLVTPLLVGFCDLLALIGGYTVMTNYGFSFARYVSTVDEAVQFHDFAGGIAKSVVFALIIGAIGCLRGLGTSGGPGAVGDSTTRAVVAGIVLIIIADGLFGVSFYYLGL